MQRSHFSFPQNLVLPSVVEQEGGKGIIENRVEEKLSLTDWNLGKPQSSLFMAVKVLEPHYEKTKGL